MTGPAEQRAWREGYHAALRDVERILAEHDESTAYTAGLLQALADVHALDDLPEPPPGWEPPQNPGRWPTNG